MKQLTCEMCGSTDLLKEGGVFVCQTCGCKYSVEEARKMMIEGTVEVTGTVKVDNSAAIDNYLKMAKNALEASNNEEAENYANKIIELEPQNSAAWKIKGEAAGWQSKTNNNRMGESVTAWINAITYADDDSRFKLREEIAGTYTNLFLAMIQLRANNFANIQDKDRLDGILQDLKNGIEMMNTLVVKGGVSFNRRPIYTQLAKKLNTAACDGFKDAKKDFGPEHSNMAKWQWERFTANCDNCVKLLEKTLELCRDDKLGKTICNNMITIAETSRDSCSWKFNVNSWNADRYDKDFSFTNEAKASRTKLIDGYKTKRSFFEKNQAEELLNVIQGNRKEEEIELGKKIYWQEHSAEKAQLESERRALNEEKEATEKQLKTLPVTKQKEETTQKIEALKKEQKGLGLFKGKEKKALQEKIDGLDKIFKQQTEEEELLKKPLNERIENVKSRLLEIESEFTKSRGAVAASVGGNYIENAIADGKFLISAQKLADHLAAIVPYPYKFVGLKQGGSTLSEFGPQWEIAFVKEDEDEKNNSIALNIYCTAADESAPIENIIIEGINPLSSGEKVGKSWCIFGSYIFMSLFKDLTQTEAEELVVDFRFGDNRTLWLRDEIRYEYASAEVNLLNIMKLNKDILLLRTSARFE